MGKKRKRVPEVLWRLFRNRARPLADAIVALIPETSDGCFCKGLCCIYCSGTEPMSFLLRPDDSSDYRRLLTRCCVVVSGDSSSLRTVYSFSRWSQLEVVRRSIERILFNQPTSSNLICCGYDKYKGTSAVLSNLTTPEWTALLQRVGDVLMMHLLMHTSLFLPLSAKKYHQVSGFPISDMQLRASGNVLRTKIQRLGHACRGTRKRKRYELSETLTGKQVPASSSGSEFLGSSCISYEEPFNKGNEGSLERNSLLTKKRARPHRWKRQKLRRQVADQESHGCHSTSHELQGGRYSEGHEKNSSRCLCCSVFCNLGRMSRNTEIGKRSIFYKSGDILYALKANNFGAAKLFSNIFGTDGSGIMDTTCCHPRNVQPCLYHSLLKLLKGLIRNTRNCPHLKLFNRHCTVGHQDTKSSGGTKFKESMSSKNKHWSRSGPSSSEGELSGDTAENDITPAASELELNKLCCPRKHVLSFIWAICRRIIPPPLLGEISNWRALRKNISKFLKLRKYEKFSLKECIHRLKISKFPLFSSIFHKDVKACGVLRHNDIARHAVMEHWLFWFFNNLISPLLQANFYVTDSEDEKLEVLYYQKSVWEKLSSEAECLSDEKYCKLSQVSAKKILESRMFGFSRVRLRPKRVGFRLLANLQAPSRLPLRQSHGLVSNQKNLRAFRNTQVRNRYFKSVNKVLQDIHVVLKGLSRTELLKFNSSVFDYKGVYQKLVPFFHVLRERSAIFPRVYIVVSDVSKAFDSIKHDKLLTVLKDVIMDDEYALEEVRQVVCSNGSLNVRRHQILVHQDVATDSTKRPLLPPPDSLDGVFISKDTRRIVGKAEINFNLKEHITRNVVLFGNNLFLQRVGIPQGSVLSPLLCSFYYEHMERSVFLPFMKKSSEDVLIENGVSTSRTNITNQASSGGSNYLLLRFIDDFLFVSTSKKQASMFFARLERGVRDYNCHMNMEKSGVNFDMEDRDFSQSNRLFVGKDGISFLRWSGLLLNCETLEIQADYTRYLNTHLSSTLTVSCQGRVGHQITRKLQAFLRPKCHPIFYDSNINSRCIVRLNIYQLFVLCAMKFICYISRLSILPKFTPQFYMKAIDSSFRYMNRLIRRKMYAFE